MQVVRDHLWKEGSRGAIGQIHVIFSSPVSVMQWGWETFGGFLSYAFNMEVVVFWYNLVTVGTVLTAEVVVNFENFFEVILVAN